MLHGTGAAFQVRSTSDAAVRTHSFCAAAGGDATRRLGGCCAAPAAHAVGLVGTQGGEGKDQRAARDACTAYQA